MQASGYETQPKWFYGGFMVVRDSISAISNQPFPSAVGMMPEQKLDLSK